MGYLAIVLAALLLYVLRDVAFKIEEISDLESEIELKSDYISELSSVVNFTQKALLVEIKNHKEARETLDMVAEMVASEIE